MRRIALEEHFVMNEPEHIERWLGLIPGKTPPDILAELQTAMTDVEGRRLELMDEAGIDYAILSNCGVVQGDMVATEAMRMAREANDYLAGVVRRHPERFGGFATVPLQQPAAGADELERAVRELGMKGVMLFGQTGGSYLDDERFDPFWERAQSLDVPVYLHAANPVVEPASYAGRPELLGATWSWTAETATHALRLIFGGVFERFPNVKFVLGHMGETLPYLLWRLDRRAQAFSDAKAVKPSEIMRKNVSITTAGIFSNEPLTCALAGLGNPSVMFSVDHPFESMAEAAKWFDSAPIDETTRENVSYRNATRLFKL